MNRARCGWTANFEQLQSCGWTANFEQLQCGVAAGPRILNSQARLTCCGWTANFEQRTADCVLRLDREFWCPLVLRLDREF